MTRKELRDHLDRKTHFQFSKELDELYNYKNAFEEMIARSGSFDIVEKTFDNKVTIQNNTDDDSPWTTFYFNDKGELK